MPILCELDDRAAADVTPLLAGQVRRTANLPDAAVALTQDQNERLLIIGPHTPFDHVLDFMHTLHSSRPGVGVVLIRNTYDPAAVASALQSGVSEVVPPGNPAQLAEASRRAIAMRVPAAVGADDLVPGLAPVVVDAEPPEAPEPSPQARVITVFSPKGGSGKTTISTNLAMALSEAGAVCLIDLDLQFGDVAISLQLAPTRSLVDAVTTDVEGDEHDALRYLITEYRPGFDCILAPVEPGAAEKIPADLIPDLITLLKSHYAYIVIDTPSQLSEHVLAALDASDHYVLLANPEIPSLKNLQLTLDTLDLLHYPRGRRTVVFNRADSAVGVSASDVETTLKWPIAAEIPASRDVPASINRGEPIVAAQPKHPVSQAIRDFAQHALVGHASGAKNGRRGGLFRRRTA